MGLEPGCGGFESAGTTNTGAEGVGTSSPSDPPPATTFPIMEAKGRFQAEIGGAGLSAGQHWGQVLRNPISYTLGGGSAWPGLLSSAGSDQVIRCPTRWS